MKTLTIFAIALLSAGVVFADAASAQVEKTRAQVIAELAQARASGELDQLNSDQPAFFAARKAAPTQGKTRAQVQAELKQAQQSGELAALNSEDPTAIQRFAARQAAKKTETLAE